MDKVQAEAILELTEAYDYGALRRAWRKLCADYHPDKCVATGMDRSVADEVLKDINEAFGLLKPLVENGENVVPEVMRAQEVRESEEKPKEDEVPLGSDEKPGHVDTPSDNVKAEDKSGVVADKAVSASPGQDDQKAKGWAYTRYAIALVLILFLIFAATAYGA